jgi:protein required for attachment to host cells
MYESDVGLEEWRLARELTHEPHRTESDKPGVVRQSAGRVHAAAMAPSTPAKKKEAEKFAREVARAREKGADENAFDRLILVSPPAFLGILRGDLAERVTRRIEKVIEKDYLHVEPRELKEHVRKHLAER